MDSVRRPMFCVVSSAKDGDTVYLAVADEHGTMVSVIQSNFRGFGSGITPPELGFCLQDRGELFDLTPDRANSYASGKRPFHTIIPAFVSKAGAPFLCFGVMGGDMQPQGHVQVLVNVIDFGMSLQEAGDAPRVRHDGSSSPVGDEMTDGGEVVVYDLPARRVLAMRLKVPRLPTASAMNVTRTPARPRSARASTNRAVIAPCRMM